MTAPQLNYTPHPDAALKLRRALEAGIRKEPPRVAEVLRDRQAAREKAA